MADGTWNQLNGQPAGGMVPNAGPGQADYVSMMQWLANMMYPGMSTPPIPGKSTGPQPPGANEVGTTPGSISGPGEVGPGSGEANGAGSDEEGTTPGKITAPNETGPGSGEAGGGNSSGGAPKTGSPLGNGGYYWPGNYPPSGFPGGGAMPPGYGGNSGSNYGQPGGSIGPGQYDPGTDPIYNPANLPGGGAGGGGSYGQPGGNIGPENPYGGGGLGAGGIGYPGGYQQPPGYGTSQDPQNQPGGGGSSGGGSVTSTQPTRNPPKPQTGGPGATQPTWDQILGPGNGVPQPGQPYAGGYAGGLPGMGGGYGTAPNLGGPASDPAAAKAAQDFLKGTINEFQTAQDRANAANEQRYQQGLGVLSGLNSSQDQMLGGLANLYGQRNTDFGTGMSGVVGASQGLLDDWLRRSGLIGQGYDALNQRVMDRTGLMGYQQGQAINQAYDRQNAQAEQDLINRGLSNTTIRPTVQRGIEADRTRALTGLAEDVNNQFNQLDMGTTNPALQFGERSGQFASQLGQGTVGALQQGVTGLAGLQGDALQFGERANQARQNLGNNIVNWIGSRNDQGPDFNTLAQLALGVGASGAGYGSIPALPAGSGTGNTIPNPQVPYYNPSTQTSGNNSQYQSPPFVPNRPVANTGSTARYATTF